MKFDGLESLCTGIVTNEVVVTFGHDDNRRMGYENHVKFRGCRSRCNVQLRVRRVGTSVVVVESRRVVD